jgi:hypothetical protein
MPEKEKSELNNTEFKVSIHGSRSLKDERVKVLLLEAIEELKPDVIVTHAEPDGVCEVARKLCQEKAIPLKLHFLNFKYLKGAFMNRSKAVFKDSDFAIFIHDGESKGCSNELELCRKLGMKYKYYRLEKTEYKKSVGFEIDIGWEWSEKEMKEFQINIDSDTNKINDY